MTTPTQTFEEMVRARSKENGGSALYRQVMEDVQADMKNFSRVEAPYGLCFAEGTLVHTRGGTKRIEDIMTGDCVLTQPEEQGEQTFKRVVRTTCFEDAPVWSVVYIVGAWEDEVFRRLVVTPNHPLWVVEKGWVQVKDLNSDLDQLLLANGETAKLVQVSPLYHGGTEGIAWQEGIFEETDGELIDLRNGSSGEFDVLKVKEWQPDQIELWDERFYYRCQVFNFEVEGCHTYYVGVHGVWAHNTNCGERA